MKNVTAATTITTGMIQNTRRITKLSMGKHQYLTCGDQDAEKASMQKTRRRLRCRPRV
jgi:hypothetical protein